MTDEPKPSWLERQRRRFVKHKKKRAARLKRAKLAARIINDGDNAVIIFQIERSIRLVEGLKKSRLGRVSTAADGTDDPERVAGKPISKAQKQAVRRLEVALKRVVAAVDAPDLDEFTRTLARECLGLIDRVPSGKHSPKNDMEQLFARCKWAGSIELDEPKRHDGDAKHIAALEAALLFERYGIPLTTTRGGKFCRLAAALYGDEDADLFHHCCAVKVDRNRA
jgi:hypothetical protein